MKCTENFRNRWVDTVILKPLLTLPGNNYCSPLPHKHSQSLVHSANTVPLTAVQHASGKRLYTEPPFQVSVYAYCKELVQITCIPVVCFLSGTTAGRVCVFIMSSPKKSPFRFVSFIIFAKFTVCSLLPLSQPNTEHTFLHVVNIF